MATKTKKRQRKLERKAAKRKAKRTTLSRQKSAGFTGLLAATASLPVLDCCLTGDLEQEGMGSLLVSRKLPDGRIAYAMFLIDAHCLGVKDSFARVCTDGEYHARFSNQLQTAEDIPPADALKLVEDAVEFARGIGFAPQGEYRKASAIFAGIDAGEATREYVFGDNGKPRYVNGPHDSPQDIDRIRRTLEANCGPDGYEIVLMLR